MGFKGLGLTCFGASKWPFSGWGAWSTRSRGLLELHGAHLLGCEGDASHPALACLRRRDAGLESRIWYTYVYTHIIIYTNIMKIYEHMKKYQEIDPEMPRKPCERGLKWRLVLGFSMKQIFGWLFCSCRGSGRPRKAFINYGSWLGGMEHLILAP